jgi:16S rRNA (uracil1498-N3)-methyltransferase
MRLNRFFYKLNLNQDSLQINDTEIYNQIKNVLKLKPGKQIIICDGNSNEALAEILNIDVAKKTINTILLDKTKNNCESKKQITLYCSILKRENFELATQKATEIGVNKIVPLICERTIKTGIKKERLEKIIKEASEQSGRGIIPRIETMVSFEQGIRQAEENDINLFFDISGKKINFSVLSKTNKIGLFIGPEGGWSKKELELAQNNKFKITTLSTMTLRAETAAIIASYLVS